MTSEGYRRSHLAPPRPTRRPLQWGSIPPTFSALGSRLVDRRPMASSEARGGSVATWLFVGVAAASSLVLGIV